MLLLGNACVDLTSIVRIHDVPPTTRHTDTEVLMQPTTLLHNHVNIQRFGKRIQRLFRDFFTKMKMLCHVDLDDLFWLLLLPFFFSSFFFLNRLHSCLCPPGLQCARWHSLLQYCTVRQPMHFRKVCPLDCGLLHYEQQMEGEGGDAVDEGAVFVVDFPSCSSSI